MSEHKKSTQLFARGFHSQERETAPVLLDTAGTIPDWLDGRLLRTGPARFEVGGQRYRHWFDGLAMLHRFQFGGGKVEYASRFLESRSAKEAAQRQKIARNELGTDPVLDPLERATAMFAPKPSDNGNVAVLEHRGQAYAFAETPLWVEIDPRTLQTLCTREPNDGVAGQLSTAHPLVDRGRVFGHVTDFGERGGYTLWSMDQSERRRLCTLRYELASYVHSFGMTERYLVFVEYPFGVRPIDLKFRKKPFIENYRWQPERGARFYVIDKNDGRVVIERETDAFFAFHHVNAWEEGDEVVVEMVTFPDASIIDRLWLDKLTSGGPSEATGELHRFRLSHKSIHRTRASEVMLELPNINGAYATQRHRYTYGTGGFEPGNFLDSLVKLDAGQERSHVWWARDCYPGEPIFVARPGSSSEDAGAILSVVFDAKAERSFLLILDAESFVELARAEIPHAIPFGFHGKYTAR
jgi:carotenoid cleavage dioxygenase-like enzyme